MNVVKTLFSILGVLVALLILSMYVQADILSVNSGGGNGLIINPDKYINSFFSQPPPAPTPTPTPTPTPSGGGGGSSGGGGATSSSISVNPNSINLTLAVNTNTPQQINITNLGSSNVTLDILQENLTGLVLLSNSSLSLSGGESKNITVTFVAPNKTGVYNGSIDVGNVKIPVSLTIKKVTLLFDSRITVLNPNSVVLQGKPLNTRITLIPMGDRVRVDVNLEYEIVNSNGTIMQNLTETVLVDSLRSLLRNFDTGSLPPGNYVIKLRLIYPNGIAVSSAPFIVVSKTTPEILLGYFIFFLLVSILFVVILLVVVFIVRIINEIRIRKELKKQEESNIKPWDRVKRL